jgi:hypothetical protein
MVDISTEVVEPESTETEEVNPIDEIISYVMATPYNTNPNILRQMLITLQNGGKNSQ